MTCFPVSVDVNLQFQIYAVFNYTASVNLYSFSSSLTQTLPTSQQNITSVFLNSTEFQKYRDLYDFYKIRSYSVILSNNVFNNNDLVSAPPLFVRLSTQLSGTPTIEGIARSDTSFEYKITNFAAPKQFTYKIPSTVLGANSNIIAGSSVWCATDSVADPLFFLQMGYITPPDFATTLTSSRAVKLVTVDLVAKCVFATPRID